MKGVILAAGKGTRLMPLTKVIPKILLPIYDKPMIYYSLELLKGLGVDDIMVVVSETNKEIVKAQLGTGEDFGVNIVYEIQKNQDGSGGAFKVSREFLNGEGCALLFADNIFIGTNFDIIKSKVEQNIKDGFSSIFVYTVDDPRRFGVLEVDDDDVVVSFEEKPENPKSNLISTGLFFYDSTIFDKVDKIKMSPRGEYEMAEVNSMYLEEGNLKAIKMDDEVKWYDAGTFDAVLDASCEARFHLTKQ